jgi:hypothetical protein
MAIRDAGGISAWTDGQTAAEQLDACLGHRPSIVRSAGVTALRERCLELANLAYNVPGLGAEMISLCEIRRFYEGESAESRVLAYALTSAGRRELMAGGPDPWLIFADPDRTLRCMKVLRNDARFPIPQRGQLARCSMARSAITDRAAGTLEIEEKELDEAQNGASQNPDEVQPAESPDEVGNNGEAMTMRSSWSW